MSACSSHPASMANVIARLPTPATLGLPLPGSVSARLPRSASVTRTKNSVAAAHVPTKRQRCAFLRAYLGLSADIAHRTSHAVAGIVDGVRLGWSTGNLSPSDFGVPLNPSGVGAGADAYPPFGEPGWAKTNRDFTVWVDDAITAATYRKVMLADWSADGSIDWSPYSQVRCGF
eukprot:6409239-Prymnesium_polylepis.1